MKPCDFCGAPEATLVADQYICDDCYIARGSCCAGEFEEEPKPCTPRSDQCERTMQFASRPRR